MKPQILKGTRDFLPEQVYKRNYIFDIIKSVFQKYGYLPIETPVMEHLSTLTGKYGEEGDKLLFKLLNNGDFLAKANKDALAANDSVGLIPSISKRGLRYDLTVPFARFVVMHQNDISFPFKRYQIQPVWRADRPQKGRYQEFYQCDVDVVGSDSLLYEAELIQIYDEVFSHLGLNVTIKVNNRKILKGIADEAGLSDQWVDMTVAIDKLDKIGEEGVRKEMEGKGFTSNAIDKVFSLLATEKLEDLNFTNESGKKGKEELLAIHDFLDESKLKNKVKFDMTLARGLGYYTGFIVEVSADDAVMGSIGGGGRYDDLTGSFGMKDMSGVGVSFGAERIYDVMEELDLFPTDVTQSTQIILLSFDKKCLEHAAKIAFKLRAANIATEVYPSAVKMKKQMKYANDRGIPYVIVIGSEEMENGIYKLKNMTSGDQQSLSMDDLLLKLQ